MLISSFSYVRADQRTVPVFFVLCKLKLYIDSVGTLSTLSQLPGAEK